MSVQRYTYLYALLLPILILSVAGFNRVVDPFWYYRDISIPGINAVKTKFRLFERYVKPAIVMREQPTSLIFGSSYAEIGLDPLHKAFMSVGKGYNFALAGAPWEMVACDVLFALKNDKSLRQMVIGIHPEAMPKKDCAADIQKMESPDERAFLFSYDAFEASINTVLEQSRHQPSHTLEGKYFYTRGVDGTASRFREYFSRYKSCEIQHLTTNQLIVTPQVDNQLDLTGLSELIKLAAEKGVRLKLVVYPRHALWFEQEYQCGTRQVRWNSLQQIALLTDAIGNGLTELWDFEGYSQEGTEKISEAVATYWQDPGHFNTELGDIMLDEIFALKPPHLGESLSHTTVAVRAKEEQQNRLKFLGENPEFLTQLQNLLPIH